MATFRDLLSQTKSQITEIEPSEAALPSITTPGLNRRVICCGDSTSVGGLPESPVT